jgi:4-carboxymuconolactone decarboxylase
LTATLPLVLSLIALCVPAFGQQALPADLDPNSRARLPYLEKKNMDERAQKVYEKLPGRSPEGVLRGPLAFAAYNTGVAEAMTNLRAAAVVEGTLGAQMNELAMLIACREVNFSNEWNSHEPSALKAGVDQKTVDAVKFNRSLDGLDEKDALVILFGRQLFRDKHVDSATFAKAVELFGRRGVVDLVAVMGDYALVGLFAAAVDQHVPEGKPVLPNVQ